MKNFVRSKVNVRNLNNIFFFVAVFLITSIIFAYLSGDPRQGRATHWENLLHPRQGRATHWENLLLIGGNSVIGLVIGFMWVRRKEEWSQRKLSVPFHQVLLSAVLVAAICINGAYYVITHPSPTPRPLVVYHVDSTDNQLTGTITAKKETGDRYLLEINDDENYWLVPEKVYDSVNVGDPVPPFLVGHE